jgi:hypothetical protein
MIHENVSQILLHQLSPFLALNARRTDRSLREQSAAVIG